MVFCSFLVYFYFQTPERSAGVDVPDASRQGCNGQQKRRLGEMMTLTGGWKMTINVAPASVAHALLLTDDRRPFGNFGS